MATSKDYTDKETLLRLYWGEELSLSEVADRLDVHKATILRYMDEHGIERRAAINPEANPDADYTDPEILHELYWTLNLNVYEIAERMNVTSATILAHMDEHGIERREGNEGFWEHLSGDEPMFEYTDDVPTVQCADLLALVQGKTPHEQAHRFDVQPRTVRVNAKKAYERLLELKADRR